MRSTKLNKIITVVSGEISDWFEDIFIRNIPGRAGSYLRHFYWSRRFQKSRSFHISSGCIIKGSENITMGNDVCVLYNCYLYAHNNGSIKIGDGVNFNSSVMVNAADDGQIAIGKNASFGPNVVIRASDHKYQKMGVPIKEQGHTGGKITIGEDVWVGSNCVILPNVTIGDGAVIGAGAVVNRDIPPYALACGVPAKVVKSKCRC